MNTAGLILLIIAQFLTGRGILHLFRIKEKAIVLFAISSIVGIAVFSLLPMLLELFKLPITKNNVLVSIVAATLLPNIFVIRRYKISTLKLGEFKMPALYEILFIVVYAALLVPSVWRCYYYPPYARDVLSGPEALSHYALIEHKISNSVFSLNLLESTPNLLKPPFITDLQIIYKMFVYPFGQLWLTVLTISFLIWIYNLVRDRLHPVLAGMITLLFLTIPEVYGYTYVLLWDYSNMVFFFAGYYYLFQYTSTKEYNQFLFGVLLLGFATFVRLDTLIFIGLTVPLLFVYLYRDKVSVSIIGYSIGLMLAVPLAFYFVWVNIFVKYYLPIGTNLESELNPGPVSMYFDWMGRINNELIFGGDNLQLYSYIVYIFILVFIADIIVYRKKLSKEAVFMLVGIAIIYFGLPLMSYFTKWFNITTAKRGIFKMFPLIIMYLCNSPLLLKLSASIKSFEFPLVEEKQVKVAPIAKPTVKKKK